MVLSLAVVIASAMAAVEKLAMVVVVVAAALALHYPRRQPQPPLGLPTMEKKGPGLHALGQRVLPLPLAWQPLHCWTATWRQRGCQMGARRAAQQAGAACA